MNGLQSTFEFEFLPSFDDDVFTNKLQAFNSTVPITPLKRSDVKCEAPAFAERYVDFLGSQNRYFELAEDPPSYFIVISLARLSEGYYSTRQWPVSVLALGDWKTDMAPPSILEFVLTLVIREAVAAASPRLRGSQHLGTKGCLCDFTASLDEVRIKVLSAYLCAHCSNALIADGHERLLNELRVVLGKQWLGAIDEAGSPAAVAGKLGYNLFVTKGLTPTWRERAMATLQEEGVKEFVKLVFAIVGGALLLWLGIKAAT